MKAKEFIEQIKNSYNTYFEDSKIFIRLSTNLYRSIDFSCFLANNKNELSGGYWENDMLSIRFSIDTEQGQFNKNIDLESELPENLKLETWDKSYLLAPTNKYMAYDRKQLKFRKTKGNDIKLLKTIDKFFNYLHDEIENDLENNLIANNYIDLVKEKL